MNAPQIPSATERILAVDPSLRSTGYAVMERGLGGSGRSAVRAITWGTIKNSPALLQTGCLVAIHETILEVIEKFAPSVAAFEAVIFVQSYKTAIVLGCARGAALLAAAGKGLAIYEYPPRRVKQAVVGRGGADKAQVAFMVRAMLGLSETPAPDAADALAVGLAHFQARESAAIRGGLLERI